MRQLTLLAAVALLGACVDVEDEASTETTEEGLAGENLSGSNLGGTNLSGSNLSGANLSGANLGGANLSGSNLSGSNLSGTNLGGNNLGGSNLSGSNLSGTNLSGTNLSGTNLSGTNLGGSNLGGSNLSGSNLAGNNLAGTNLSGANLSTPNIGINIHGTSTPLAMLRSGEDVYDPTDQKSCIVMGIGSTALAKLLGQQSATSKMHTAIGKTPWGFSASSAGTMTLAAWEAVVWGDRTYCTFVIVSPTNATYEGVAGFVKALWRWTAPPSQTMEIGQIGGGKTIQNYTGMMNAGARVREGSLSGRDYVAGELAFVTATTNNQVVSVDFASWAQTPARQPMILGNVTSTNPPQWAEAVYVALDNGDGTVQIAVANPYSYVSGWPTNPVCDAPVCDGLGALGAAYERYRLGLAMKPIPKRCAGALYLTATYGEPLPTGKCDNGIAWAADDDFSSFLTWEAFAGTTAPYNQYMVTNYPNSGMLMSARTGGWGTPIIKPVIGATYIHLYEKPW